MTRSTSKLLLHDPTHTSNKNYNILYHVFVGPKTFERSNNNTDSACRVNSLGGAQGAVWAWNAPDPTICYTGNISTHPCAKIQPHAPLFKDVACTQAFHRCPASLAGGGKWGDPARRDE